MKNPLKFTPESRPSKKEVKRSEFGWMLKYFGAQTGPKRAPKDGKTRFRNDTEISLQKKLCTQAPPDGTHAKVKNQTYVSIYPSD